MNSLDRNTWYIIAAVLGVCLVAGLAWFLRQASVRRAPVPGAFLIALLVHLLLGGGMFCVVLGGDVSRVVKKIQDVFPVLSDYAASTQFEAHEGYRAAPQPFELVKELAAKDSVAAANVSQQPLETPEMQVTSDRVKTEIPVPREDSPGQRADQTPVVPNTPAPLSPARTNIPVVETPVAPAAPIDAIPTVPQAPKVEPRAVSENIEVARAAPLVDPLASAKLSRSSIPDGPAEKVLPSEMRDERTVLSPNPVAPLKSAALVRSTRPGLEVENAQVEAVQPVSAGAAKNTASKTAVAVNVGRQTPTLPGPNLTLPAPSPHVTSAVGGGASPVKSTERGDPLPTFKSADNGLARRPLDASLSYAEADIGPEALIRSRKNDNNPQAIEQRGGNKASQEAVERGLSWLQQHQFPDGRWSLHDFSQRCVGHAPCTAQGNLPCDTAATALSLLPFLGNGHTQHEGKYPTAVQRGLDWLVQKQRRSGELTTGNEGKARMYGHGIAAIALCEAYAMSQDPRLREPAQRSLDFIVASQNKASGGWRYQPNEPADTSVVGWQIMALKSGQMARLNVPQQPFDLARKWLDSVEGQGSQQGHFGYQDRNPTPAMTAEGLLCRQYLGATRDDPSLVSGAGYLLTNLPDKSQENAYYWYYGTQTMYHLQGDYWKKWNAALRDMLVETQIKEGPMAGTWAPVDRGEVTGGRVYATSLRVLMLEVYYRHLPLYQSLEE
jgi:hypothetical protein